MIKTIYSLFNELHSRNILLITAESLTGGLIAERITEVPGASTVFWGGLVAYSEEAKQTILKVPTEILARHGAVSTETAQAMAEGALMTAGNLPASYAIAVTGFAGPDSGTADIPVGTVYIACAGNEKGITSMCCKKYMFNGTRNSIREQTYTAAMQILMQQLDKVKNNKL